VAPLDIRTFFPAGSFVLLHAETVPVADASDTDRSGTTLARLRARLTAEPDLYWRLWLTGVNLVGLVVLSGALLDLRVVIGTGRTGIYRRSLYPLVPPALTLGAALAGPPRGRPRRIALSGGLLVGYVGILAVVGVLGEALRRAPAYPAAGLVGCLALAGIGAALARRADRVSTDAGEGGPGGSTGSPRPDDEA
jgi:hypothetical protein